MSLAAHCEHTCLAVCIMLALILFFDTMIFFCCFFFFFFNDTATTEIYTLSLHDALPISHALNYLGPRVRPGFRNPLFLDARQGPELADPWLTPMSIVVSRLLNRSSDPMQPEDRKSTRLNSSHLVISYAVFCLKKKKDNHH